MDFNFYGKPLVYETSWQKNFISLWNVSSTSWNVDGFHIRKKCKKMCDLLVIKTNEMAQKNSWSHTMKRKVMSSKQHVRELNCKRSKKGHIYKFDKFDRQLVNRCFSKDSCVTIPSKKWMIDVYFTPLLLNWIQFSCFKWNTENVKLMWWLQGAHLDLTGKNEGIKLRKNHILYQPYLWETIPAWVCSLLNGFNLMFNKVMLYKISSR